MNDELRVCRQHAMPYAIKHIHNFLRFFFLNSNGSPATIVVAKSQTICFHGLNTTRQMPHPHYLQVFLTPTAFALQVITDMNQLQIFLIPIL